MRRSPGRPLLVSARLNHCVAFNPSPVTSLTHSLFTQCQGPTCGFLAARPRPHPVPLYLAFTLTLTHLRSHAGYLMHDILLTHIFAHCHASSHSHPAPRCRALTLSHVHIGSLCFASHLLTLPLYLLFSSHTGLVLCRAIMFVRCSHTHHRQTISLSRSH